MNYVAYNEETVVRWICNEEHSWYGGFRRHPTLISGIKKSFINYYEITNLPSGIENSIFSIERYSVKKKIGQHLFFTSVINFNIVLFLLFWRFWTSVWSILYQMKHNFRPNLIKKDYKDKRKLLSNSWKVKAISQNMMKKRNRWAKCRYVSWTEIYPYN